MKRSGPLLTLLTGLLLALFMLSLNATTETGASSYGEDAPAPDASASSPTGSPSAGPSAEPTRTPAAKAPAKVPAKAEYAGRTDDDTSAVSISVRDGKAIAYYCDGRDTESWLKGNVEEDGSMRLTGKHGAKLDGQLTGKKVRGTVDVDKETRKFTADKAVRPSGLYRATTEVRGAKVDGGWIVLPDGRQVGILKRDDEPEQAPRLDPGTGTVRVDGETLTARPVTP
ncbi:hypothetical protein DEJ48_30880 [Streptomyces venezuelae]|uniref:Serine/threonine protein kinase n=1 Tax=Streptomyces venezuelae TaxID=54571 RepID=A0A5P2C364_STRVZ|nr:hypothetical protein [Streptomyces venezuelae]QES37225.1 hypothetical protein DEJ48_30880 [Streptomyces venezuelae]